MAKAGEDRLACSRNVWYAPKALQQARLVRLRSRKCWLQLSWTRTRELRHWGRYATEVDIAVVQCFGLNLLSHRLTSKDAQRSQTTVYELIYHA